jgi:hypothetical protein
VTLRISDGLLFADSTIIIDVGDINDAPIFLTIPDTLAIQDTAYTSVVTAEDIDGDTLVFTAPTLPLWLVFNDTTNTLSGIPTNNDVGDNTVTLRINDGTIDVDTTFIIQVSNVNDPPGFLSTADTVTLEDALYTYTVLAEDIDGDSVRYGAPVIPLWLNFDSLTNVLSGTPTNDDVGLHSIALTINDSIVEVVQAFTIEVVNVNDRPTVTSTPVTDARPGVAYTYTVTATDIDGDALSYSAIVLPGWLTFNTNNQTLSATPGEEDIGDQFVTIRISDGSLYTDHTFVISVTYSNHAPTFTSDPSTSVVVGDSYVYTIVAQDIDGDALSYSAPVLPGWLTYYPATQVISGVPSSSDIGRHDVTVRVSDGTVSADQVFPIFVENANTPPSFTSTPVTNVTAGDLYVYIAEASDVDGDVLYYTALTMPEWLNFDANTRNLHGTPSNDDAGDHNVTLRVSDGESAENQNFVVSVEFVYGLNEIESHDLLLVYPNPTDGRFFVEMSQEVNEELVLEILDPIGRVLQQQIFPPYSLINEEYNLSGSSPGMYFIRIYDESSQIIKKLLLH